MRWMLTMVFMIRIVEFWGMIRCGFVVRGFRWGISGFWGVVRNGFMIRRFWGVVRSGFM